VSMGRTGKTILFSGIIVMLCLSTLLVVNSPSFSQMGLGAALAVGCALLAALTLLPAVLGLLGPRVELGRLPWRDRVIGAQPGGDRHGFLARWARMIMRRPVVVAVLVAGLLLAAVPALNMRLGIDFAFRRWRTRRWARGSRYWQRNSPPAFSHRFKWFTPLPTARSPNPTYGHSPASTSGPARTRRSPR